MRKIFYKNEPKVLPEVISAVKEANLIILSMGSLYTSILPTIICKEVQEAFNEAKAPLMYICNIVTQPGETDKYTVSDHVKLINNHLNKRKLDVVVANKTLINKEIAKRYETKERKDPVPIDYDEIDKIDIELIDANLMTIDEDTLKHDGLKLGSIIFSYLMRD